MKLTGGDHVAREMKYLYDKADYDAMREKLGAVDWEAEFKERPIEESWLFFKQKLHTVLDRPVHSEKRSERRCKLDLIRLRAVDGYASDITR